MNAILRWFAVAFVTASVACSGGGPTPATKTGEPPASGGSGPAAASAAGCNSDRDCASGQGCADSGLCIPLASEGQGFSVAVVPPSGDPTLIPDQFTDLRVGAGGNLDLTLGAPVEVRGVVAFRPEPSAIADPAAAPALELVAGLLVATAPGLIPGTQFRSEAAVQGVQKIGQDWTFSLRLLPGIPYTITFLPSEDPARGVLARLPTWSFSAQFTKSDGGYQVLLPAKSDYLKSVIQGVVLLDESGTQPVEGARVSVKGADLTATDAYTDAKGIFRLVVPPAAATITLRVEPGKGAPGFPIREFTYEDGAQTLLADATPRFVVGPVPPVRDVLIQVYHVSSASLVPVPGARVEADGVAGLGTASGYTVTGADGVAHLTLFQGLYALAVIPPEGSPFAARVSPLDLDANPDTSVFHVPLDARAKIHGVVIRDTDGAPVPGAVVTFQTNRVQAFEGASSNLMDLTVTAVSDASGAFEVPVDPGVHALTVIPPAASGLARFSQPDVTLTDGDADLTVRLVPGVLVRGRLVAEATGAPVAGAQVQFFFQTAPGFRENWSSISSSFAAAVQTAGVAITNAAGVYSVIVPRGEGEPAGEAAPTGSPATNGSADVGFGLPAVEVNPSPH